MLVVESSSSAGGLGSSSGSVIASSPGVGASGRVVGVECGSCRCGAVVLAVERGGEGIGCAGVVVLVPPVEW